MWDRTPTTTSTLPTRSTIRKQPSWPRAGAELAEARRLRGEGSLSSVARLRRGYWGVPKVREMYEATYFAGLRKAGMPEE